MHLSHFSCSMTGIPTIPSKHLNTFGLILMSQQAFASADASYIWANTCAGCVQAADSGPLTMLEGIVQ